MNIAVFGEAASSIHSDCSVAHNLLVLIITWPMFKICIPLHGTIAPMNKIPVATLVYAGNFIVYQIFVFIWAIKLDENVRARMQCKKKQIA